MGENNKIRVLQAIRQGKVGGGESHLLSLVENLDRSRFDPIVLSFSSGPMVDRLIGMGIPTTVIHSGNPFNLFKWRLLKKFMQDNQVDLIHAHGTRANSNIFWIAKKLDIPLVYTVHGWSFHDDQNPILKKIRILGEILLTRLSDINISVSSSNRETGIKYFRDFRSEIINNGIDQEKFNPEKKFKDIRSEWGISGDAIMVLFIARFIRQKQPLVLIRAFAKALQRVPNLQLVMVGEGDQKDKAMLLVKSLQIQNHVIFQPFRDDVPDIMAAANIFVLPSLWEGLPIALLEAMSMGKAIIATPADGTSEIIIDGYNGILPELGNLEESISNAMVELAICPERSRKLGLAARKSITQGFTVGSMTRKIESIYLKLMQTYMQRR